MKEFSREKLFCIGTKNSKGGENVGLKLCMKLFSIHLRYGKLFRFRRFCRIKIDVNKLHVDMGTDEFRAEILRLFDTNWAG